MDLMEGRSILERTPAILVAWLNCLPAAWLETSEGADAFSPRDVLGHLIHGERTDWIPRLRLLREFGETRPFEAFDRVGFKDAIQGRAIGDLLDDFAGLRRENLGELDSFALGPADLAKRGIHPALGPVTAAQLLATWVTHDLNHLGQIARVMARRQDEAVGPWKSDLAILQWKPRG
ncbi:MAG: DinB family protein [Candidatus Eisenbacteria bacterium]